MVAGQCSDLDAEARNVTTAELDSIHNHKTGAMITAAARCGAIIAAASDREVEQTGQYATKLGLMFQITDDILDVTATAENLGKTPGKDARARKATYPSLYGLEATRKRARHVYEEACSALNEIDRPTEMLRAIAAFILERGA